MSLRWKIALALGVLAASATMAVGVASYRATSDRLVAEIDRSLVSAANSLPRNTRNEIVALPARGPLASYDAQVLDRSGRVRLTTFTAAVEPTARARELTGDSRSRLAETVGVDGVDHRVLTVGVPNGAIQIARSLAENDRVLKALRQRSFVVVLVVTASAVLMGLVIAGRVTASLRRLTHAAETVGATGRLDVDVYEPGVDEVARLAHAFDTMLAALRTSRDEQRRLVADAGHELRTPLTSLRTNLEVLQRYPDLPADDRARLVSDLRSETEELVQLVDEIMTVASGTSDDEPIETFQLHEVVAEVAQRAQRRFDRRVDVTVEGDAAWVSARPAAVQRAVSNLIDNAVKFDDSAAAIEVVVAGGRVDVSDRGPGIGTDDVSKVFDRFHRADAAKSLPGSGLGLSIVRDVAERHGGTVHISTREGGGATVGLELPVVPVPHAPPAGASRDSADLSPDS